MLHIFVSEPIGQPSRLDTPEAMEILAKGAREIERDKNRSLRQREAALSLHIGALMLKKAMLEDSLEEARCTTASST
jgi:hypothetical protein